MNAAAPPSPTPAAPPRRRRWGRWLGGLALFGMVTLGVLWELRLALVRLALARALPAFPATVEQVEWRAGGIEVQGLSISGKDKVSWLRLPRAHLSVSPLRMLRGELGEVTLERLALHLTPDIINDLSAPQAASSKEPMRFHLTGLQVQDAAVEVLTPTGETAALVLNWQGGALARLAGGRWQAARQRISLRQLKLQPDAETPGAAATEITLECSADAATQQVTIHHLQTSELSAQAGKALWRALGLAGPQAAAAAVAPTARPVESVVLEDVVLGPMAVAFQDLPWLPALPPGHGHLLLSAQHVTSSLRDGSTQGEMQLALTDFSIGEAGGTPLLSLPKMTAAVHGLPAGGWHVRTFHLEPTEVRLATERLTEFGLQGWLPALALAGTLRAEAADLTIQNGEITSPTPPELTLSEVQVQRPGAAQPLLAWEELTVSGRWGEMLAGKHLHHFQWRQPVVNLTGADVQALTPPAPPNVPVEPPSGVPAWHGWQCDDLQIMDGQIHGQALGAGVPDFSTQLELQTMAGLWQLAFNDVHIATPDLPTAPPLYEGQSVRVDVDPQALWREHRIERVRLLASRVRLGATAADHAPPLPAADLAVPPLTPAAPAELMLGPQPLDWHVGNLEFSNTKIYLHHLIPDGAEILLPLAQKTLRNIPLTLDGLLQCDEPQRLELPYIYVPGTRVGTTVADFDTNFVHFSLAGLMRREIELVELVNPKIYVGDSLFHYVDQLRAQAPAEPLAKLSAVLASLITALGDEDLPSGNLVETNPGWRVNHLKALNGKLITTVKDSPLLRIPPLPFGADSSMAEGKINAQLAVPPGLYKPLLGTELVVAISEGNLTFNLPLKHQDNNLVQVFKADWLRYKQLRIDNVTLQVTYDKNGVYAKFWAHGYHGELQAEFNLYLDDNLSWDGWLTGTQLDMAALTAALTPNYCQMTGPVSGKIIAQGDKTSLYQATGEFATTTHGQIKITALDDALKALPADWADLKRQPIEKLLTTLRDFAYTNCTGKLRFYGLEGELHLNLTGPDGARNFDIHSHDRRASAAD